jgi:hypothetical protein
VRVKTCLHVRVSVCSHTSHVVVATTRKGSFDVHGFPSLLPLLTNQTLTNPLASQHTPLSAMDTREWFGKGPYSDLTIKLSDGTEVKVHKVIVCQANEYFRKLCGPDSHFAVSFDLGYAPVKAMLTLLPGEQATDHRTRRRRSGRTDRCSSFHLPT